MHSAIKTLLTVSILLTLPLTQLSLSDVASASTTKSVVAPTTDMPASADVYRHSTAAARKQGAAFPKFGMTQGYQPLNLNDSDLNTTLNGIVATGAHIIRLDLNWYQIQSGGPTSFDFTNTLRVYKAALAHGLIVLPVTSGIPAWAGTVSPTSNTSYQNFLFQAGLQLIPLGISTVELWNEANLTGMSPATYTTNVLAPGAIGFRQAGAQLGKTVTIVSTGLAPAGTGGGYYSQLDFLKGIYAAGGRGYVDVVGNHPYTWPADPSIPSSWNWMMNTQQLHDFMVTQGDGGKQIWATEFGFPTNTGANGVSEAVQAKFIANGAKVWASFPWAGPILFYSYQDLAPLDSNPEDNFGLVRFDGTAKPALAVVTGIMTGH